MKIESHTVLFTTIFEQALKLGIELKLKTIEVAGILGGMTQFLREDPRTLRQILDSKKKEN